MNPHLNIRKRPRHTHDREPNQTPPKGKKNIKVVHIDEDTLEASPHGHSPTSVNPMAAEFLPFLQVPAKNKKEDLVQIIVQPTLHYDHTDSVA